MSSEPSASSARAASRPARTIRSSWWNSSRPTPSVAGVITTAPRRWAASTAPPAPIIIVRSRVSPSAGTRGGRTPRARPLADPPPIEMLTATTGPSSRSRSRSTGRLSTHAAVHQQLAAVGRGSAGTAPAVATRRGWRRRGGRDGAPGGCGSSGRCSPSDSWRGSPSSDRVAGAGPRRRTRARGRRGRASAPGGSSR